jgi:molybdopterin-containing oxidoreductase family membrane subunit
MARTVPGVLGQFVHIDGAADAIRELKATGFPDLTVYSAMHSHELEGAVGDPVSPLRWFTLLGGMLGCAAGFSLAIWMSHDWPLITGGKSVAALPPFVVMGFELTVLIGSLSSVAAIIILSARKKLGGRPYHPSFSDDRIGVFVPCGPDRAGTVQQLLEKHGSVEVSRES